jgi:type II secretory ATPase GspE/PulE/Tfp pilus assembly ATPase PilB-like protein
MTALEKWAVERSLVLINQIHQWRDEDGEAYDFRAALVRRSQDVNDSRWLDALGDFPGLRHVLPLPSGVRVARLAFSPAGRDLRARSHAIAVQDDPVIVLAAVDPFGDAELRSQAREKFPGQPVEVIYSSPAACNLLASQCECLSGELSSPPSGEAQPWSALLGPGFALPEVRDIVDALWQEGAAFLPDGWIAEAALIADHAAAFGRTERRIWAASPIPFDPHLKDRIFQLSGLQPVICAVTPEEFERLARAQGAPTPAVQLSATDLLHVEDWRIEQHDDTALYQRIVTTAIDLGATDIHLDPKPERTRVRFRIDGTLYEQAPLPKSHFQGLLRTAKIQGGMIQGTVGQIQSGGGYLMHAGRRYDLRYEVSVFPNPDGAEECLNVRIFNSRVLSLGDLRLPVADASLFQWFLEQGSGMSILSGPTGSGKTTTLYAMLKALDTPGRSLITIEQPVEKHYESAKQFNALSGGELTFAAFLRSVLRQDPDVIMVGEIRDAESARIAVQAAITGHPVLTTVHANDAAGIIHRLQFSYGIDLSTLSVALKLCVAQRLVPRNCPMCRTLREPKPEDVELFPHVALPNPVVGESVGCAACRFTKVLGRALVMESLAVDQTVSSMIANHRPLEDIALCNARRGHPSLVHQATSLFLTGEIPLSAAKLFIMRPSH